MKKILIVLLVLGVVAFTYAPAFAFEESIRNATIIKLEDIYFGQRMYYDANGTTYPSPGGCPNNVCWQGQMLSSLTDPGNTGSNRDLIDVLGSYPTAFCPGDLSINTLGNGDVRFRCRRQGANPQDVWCFAYRCQEASPAGCRQLWRLRFKPRSDGAATPLECFDVGNTGVCSGAPSTIISGWKECN